MLKINDTYQVYRLGLKEEKGSMAKYSSSINYKITTSLDASGITKLQAELNKLEREFLTLHSQEFVTDKQREEALRDIRRIQEALKTAFTNSSILFTLAIPKLEPSDTGFIING